MAIADYFARPDSDKILLAIITYSGGTLYLSDRPYVTDPADVPANQLFEPIIQIGGVPEFRQSIQELTGGRSVRSFGSLKLVSADVGSTDLRTVVLRNASIELRIAAPRKLFPFADSVLWFKGIVGTSKGSTDGRISYQITDRQNLLESITIPQNIYASGVGVPADLVGRAKPLAFGTGRAPMFLIDAINLNYQIHDGALNPVFDGIAEVRDDGNSLIATGSCTVNSPPTDKVTLGSSFSSLENFYTGARIVLSNPSFAIRTIIDYLGGIRLATLDSNVTQAHTVASVDLFVPDDTTGTVRLLAPAEGLVTAEFANVVGTGDLPGVVEHLATTYGGMIGADIDVTTEAVGTLGLWFADQVSLADIFTSLARGEFAWWGFDRNDKLVMRPIDAPILPANHTVAFDDFVRETVTWQEDVNIVWRVIQLLERNWANTGSSTLAERDEAFIRRQVVEDATVKTNFDDAIERTLQSYSSIGTTAAQRALDFFKVRRFVVDGQLPFDGTIFNVGETIEITGVPEPINSPLFITGVRGTSDARVRLAMVG